MHGLGAACTYPTSLNGVLTLSLSPHSFSAAPCRFQPDHLEAMQDLDNNASDEEAGHVTLERRARALSMWRARRLKSDAASESRNGVEFQPCSFTDRASGNGSASTCLDDAEGPSTEELVPPLVSGAVGASRRARKQSLSDPARRCKSQKLPTRPSSALAPPDHGLATCKVGKMGWKKRTVSEQRKLRSNASKSSISMWAYGRDDRSLEDTGEPGRRAKVDVKARRSSLLSSYTAAESTRKRPRGEMIEVKCLGSERRRRVEAANRASKRVRRSAKSLLDALDCRPAAVD